MTTTRPDGLRSLFIKTWGCQMNVYDSARMADVLAPVGYFPASTADEADMVILNTCHIREKATEKLFSELGRLRDAKERRQEQGHGMIVAVAGCVAQAEGAEILARAPWVDMVFGPQTYHDLPDMVAKVERDRLRVLNTEFPPEPKFDRLPEESRVQGPSAFLAVQEGCDKFCTFCVVPYTRGAEYSRPAAAVIAEARRLVRAGTLEITLLGQNVNAWHGEAPDGGTWSLGRLIRALAEIEGLERIRYTTSHPRDVDEELIAAHRDVPQLMPFLHLPVQSGSDAVLKAMNRRHDVASYLNTVDRLFKARPDLALSSDFIVGFPGETDRDFADTLNLVTTVGFAQAYSFKYSPRPGTPAAGHSGQVEESVKADRLEALHQLLGAQQLAFNRATVGRRVPVLFDRAGRKPGQIQGRSPWMQSVYAAAPARLIGRIVEVEVTVGLPQSLTGQIVMAAEEVA